ncbi:hypothetical protein HZI73_01110 [Vallitalea pronyensis]|uniref:Uncharacterized protein n=1 Tax=Vallitalea pronyensis TaxID=1348613 RepID=A0A8J8MGU1_9FIRM|nr:hypothetical protein [Vallitalea pronyensis]QUI20978.1 hypothetical protein HZI73_01110 [Vallitalea pronyensis]
MKKKKITLMMTLIAAITVLTVTVFASSSVQENGYETLKDTLFSMEMMDNKTVSMNAEIIDNGQSIAMMEGVAKVDPESKDMSGAFKFSMNDLTKSIEMYKNGDTHILVDKINDLYYQIEKPVKKGCFRGRKYHKRFEDHDKEMTPQQEAFFDFIVGDLKDNFSIKSSQGGNKVISFNMKEEDIPVSVNLLLSAAASMHEPEEHKMDKFPMALNNIPLLEGMDEVHKIMPKLKDDIKLLEVNVDLTVNPNDQIIGNAFVFTFEGKDAEGTHHEIMVKGIVSIEDIQQTTVDTIDVSDKEVTFVDVKKFMDMCEEYND